MSLIGNNDVKEKDELAKTEKRMDESSERNLEEKEELSKTDERKNENNVLN